jgi:hypothetical protein
MEFGIALWVLVGRRFTAGNILLGFSDGPLRLWPDQLVVPILARLLWTRDTGDKARTTFIEAACVERTRDSK